MRLMAPPLPAASQPSNTQSTGTRRLNTWNSSSRKRTCNLPICSSYCFSLSFLFMSMRSSMGGLLRPFYRDGVLFLFTGLLLLRAGELGIMFLVGCAGGLGRGPRGRGPRNQRRHGFALRQLVLHSRDERFEEADASEAKVVRGDHRPGCVRRVG